MGLTHFVVGIYAYLTGSEEGLKAPKALRQ
jgi:hypothetical protein